LIEYLNAKTSPSKVAAAADVEAVLQNILDTGEADYYFEDYVWRWSSGMERQALVIVAESRQQVLVLDEEALDSLKQREILTQDESGDWRYRIELVKRWVAQKKCP
jgi:hypothetical protein